MSMLNKHIILGITGGIAAYKSAQLARLLCKAGATVRVVMTRSAKEFITPLTMSVISKGPVFDEASNYGLEHIKLARWADLILIAPATANFIAQLAHGYAPDLLSTICLASNAKLAVAPAMNAQMWCNIATQENIQKLRERDVVILGPKEGEQACSEVGIGRMLEPEEIVGENLFEQDILGGVNVLITAGPTREEIDPVRYLSNRSSGKMGYAMAEAAVAAGSSVTLISGPVHLAHPNKVKCINVTNAKEMLDAVMHNIGGVDLVIGAAAVADYRYDNVSAHKIKKQENHLTLELTRNPDILSEVTSLKEAPFTVGFAAETDNLVDAASNKLERKKLDMIIANQVGMPNQGFDSDTNACIAIWGKFQKEFPIMQKGKLANDLISLIAKNYHEKCSIKDIR